MSVTRYVVEIIDSHGDSKFYVDNSTWTDEIRWSSHMIKAAAERMARRLQNNHAFDMYEIRATNVAGYNRDISQGE